MNKSPNYRTRGDPLKVFPTHLSQRIFGLLDIQDLAKCARVCKKWHSSQSINYGRVYFSTLVIFLLILGQYGFEDIVRKILMTRVSLLVNGRGGNRSKTGYGASWFLLNVLTLSSTENLVRAINSGPRVGWFWVHNFYNPFGLPVTEGDEGRAMAE